MGRGYQRCDEGADGTETGSTGEEEGVGALAQNHVTGGKDDGRGRNEACY